MKFFTVLLLDVILSHLYSFNCCVIYVWILLVVVGLFIYSCLFDFFSLLSLGLLVLYYSLLIWSV